MAKKAAVVAFNPVNGAGMFQYLEIFQEKGIPHRTFAISDSPHIKSNSGISITLDDVIGNLCGHENEYDVLVFACGSRMMHFADNIDEQYNQDLIKVVKKFWGQAKPLVGHCAIGLVFDVIGISEGRRVAVNPIIKPAMRNTTIISDNPIEIDGNLYTASTEQNISQMVAEVLKIME